MQKFFKGLDSSLTFIEKEKKERAKIVADKKSAKAAAYGGKKVFKKPMSSEEERKKDGVKRTGRVHVVSKRNTSENE